MKKFNFRFQTLLDIRTRELEKAELKVAEAQLEVFKATEFLKKIEEEVVSRKLNLEKLISSGDQLDITCVNNSHNYINYLKVRIFEQKKIIKVKEKALDEVRKDMLKVRQKKKMLDKLKEKDLKEYKQEFERLDLMQIDEMTTSRHNRGNSF